MNRPLTKKKNRLLITRIFAGVMIFVWLGNSVPTLAAMTRHPQFCDMSCCKDLHHPATFDSSGKQSCPIMSQMSGSHEAMPGMDESMPGMDNIPVDEVTAEKYKNILFVAPADELPHSKIESQSDSDDKNIIPFIRVKMAEGCSPVACVISSSGSNAGQRQQSADNCILITFAAHPRPPTFLITTEIETQVIFIVKQQVWLSQMPSRGPPPSFFS